MFDYNRNALSTCGWQPCHRGDFEQMCSLPAVSAVCMELERLAVQYESGLLPKGLYATRKSQLKKQLPAFAFHAHFAEGRRRNAEAVGSGLYMVDIDGCERPRELWELLSNYAGEWQVVLAHVTPSGRGLRLVFALTEGDYRAYPTDTIVRMQGVMQERLEAVLGRDPGVDTSVKDLARISFAVPMSYVLYVSDELFGDHGAPDVVPMSPYDFSGGGAVAGAVLDEEIEEALAEAEKDVRTGSSSEGSSSEGSSSEGSSSEGLQARLDGRTSYIPLAHETRKGGQNSCDGNIIACAPTGAPEKTGQVPVGKSVAACAPENATTAPAEPLCFKGVPYSEIIEKYWDVMGGKPDDGERNTKLHQLAYHLRYICDFDAKRLKAVMPTYGLSDREMDELISSALKAPRYSYSIVMRKVLGKTGVDRSFDKRQADYADEQPPQMPEALPPLIELLVQYMPANYQAAVAHGVFPPLATHLRDVRFRYIDNIDHEATLMCVLMAGSSAGKSCLTRPISYLMADIRCRDAQNMLREKLWKQECSSLGANKQKPSRPEGLIIQEVDPDITNPAFVMRMKEAEPSPLYAQMNEIEQFDNLRSSRGGKAQFQIMCLAFDPDNRYGQTRVGTNSVTEKVCVRFNWNASTTITKGQRYFKNVVNDGPLSRINFCTIPAVAIGEEMPVYGTYPDNYATQLQPYLDNLCQANGLIDCAEARDFARRMVSKNAAIASYTQSRVFEHLSFRAAVIAWLKACVLYVAQGRQWDERIETFCEWSMDYDLWCKMRFFSEAMEEAMSRETLTPWRKDNLLNRLRATFTLAEAQRVHSEAGCRGKLADVLRVWQKRGFIVQNDDGTYTKRDRTTE